MLTLSAFRLTKRGIGSPLTEPVMEPVTSARAAAIPAHAEISITDRQRTICLMRDAIGIHGRNCRGMGALS
jgi:hypothetical protein